MFHRFSATPGKVRQTKGSGSARSINKNHNKGLESNSIAGTEHASLPLAKRQKTARACDRCRRQRIKCDEQKPCAQCVGIKAQCIVSSAPPHSSQTNKNPSGDAKSGLVSALPPTSPSPSSAHATRQHHNASTSSSTPSSMATNQQRPWPHATSPDAVSDEVFDVAHVDGFFASTQPTSSPSSTSAGCLFPQLPHPAVPSVARPLASDELLGTQRYYFLRLFWDTCHPLLQVMSEV